MTRIWTPIPESTWAKVTTFLRRGVINVAWGLFLLTVAVLLVIGAASNIGVLGSIVLGILISVVLADDIRALVSDLWHRDFHSIKLNLKR